MAYPWSTDRSRPTPYRDTKPFIILSFPSEPQEIQPSRVAQWAPYPPHTTHSPLPRDNILPPPVDLLAPSTRACLCPKLTHLLRASTLDNSWLQTPPQTAVLSLSTQTSWLTKPVLSLN